MNNLNSATMVFEDGSVYNGQAFGAHTNAVFELVFNTSMTGYQEILTDPSYRGQGVLFTVPHIGNVGITPEDNESVSPQISAVVTLAISPIASRRCATTDLSSWLSDFGVPGIAGVDTRAITRKLRVRGTLKAALSTNGTDEQTLLQMACDWRGLDGRDMVREVTCEHVPNLSWDSELHLWAGDAGDKWVIKGEQDSSIKSLKPRVVVIDFGAKRNIYRHLSKWNAEVLFVSADTTAAEIIDLQPDGVMLSNGPGDPAGLPYAIDAVRELIGTGLPMFGICLGHQLLGLALGGKTARLKFGHHGGNHPVQDIATRKVYITAQNHNYVVLPESLNSVQVQVTHLSLNDGSLEGMRLVSQPIYSVQFHPESAPGPHDAHEFFRPFFKSMQERNHAGTI